MLQGAILTAGPFPMLLSHLGYLPVPSVLLHSIPKLRAPQMKSGDPEGKKGRAYEINSEGSGLVWPCLTWRKRAGGKPHAPSMVVQEALAVEVDSPSPEIIQRGEPPQVMAQAQA